MPSAFSHAIAAVAVARGAPQGTFSLKLVILAMVSAVIPDLDSIGFAMGIPYSHWCGHRGITHSLFFALCWAALVSFFFFRRSHPGSAFVVLLLATFSHPLLDMFTNGGLGCALWAPFSNERLFFPWRPIRVAPIAVDRFFSADGWRVLKSEMVWVWSPSAVLYLIAALLRQRSSA